MELGFRLRGLEVERLFISLVCCAWRVFCFVFFSRAVSTFESVLMDGWMDFLWMGLGVWSDS